MLVWSSLVFLTNTVHAAFRGYGIYALAFLLLATTSVFLHTSDRLNSTPFWIDQIAIYIVFCIGLLYFLQISRKYKIVPLISILIVIVLYFGGWATNTLCWEPGPNKEIYHAYMHLIGSAGHHCIIAAL